MLEKEIAIVLRLLKEVKCLMRILCVKVIWEAEALIFQNSSGKFMNVVKSYICDNVFIEDLQIFADPVLICFANSAWETLCFENELIDWVSENLECLISRQLLNKSWLSQWNLECLISKQLLDKS